MSVVSSRVSGVSSILKSPGVRSQLIRQSNRVYFKLPKDLKNIIYNFESGNGTKEYEDLICILQDSSIKDTDLIEFLSNVRQCISLLGPFHKVFVETLLQIKWTSRSLDVTSSYKAFIEDLICMQIHYAKTTIDNLVEQFKPEEDVQRLNHIHDILHKILKVVPMSSELLLQSLIARFPYIVHGTHTHEVYVYALIQILEYAPQLRSDILSLIINRLMVLDVNIPRLEIDNKEEDLMDDGSECDSILGNENNVEENNITETDKIHPIAHKLDIGYGAKLVKAVQFRMSKWIHDYINMQDYSKYIDDESKEHSVFYSVCQALFLIITKRHNDYPDSKKYMLYLQELDLAKIITCKLNPLKACHPDIVHNFAEITRMYQLAYCYTIIENNTRNQLPIFDSKNSTISIVENFFPFNSYTLPRSGQRIISLLRHNVSSSECRTTIKYKEDIEYMTTY
ncbi:RNA polymerase I-specific transcription initiation factor RRN3 [Habropoda laboriosa]|uniref:RNA polymerase I-specific transcription initiation factor RRN3 n=1 Tax=Habropoda laboriosa TaxID=597456 RepID=A0A0L7QVZ8_9HYME|nr:RNA polymerase I-specific transcription initiation factor RRN3 [Habropoda laboriosa]